MIELMRIAPHVGKPIGIRHHYSGVWLGRVTMPRTVNGIEIPGGVGLMNHMIEIEGRRIWSWEGGRLEFSELCKKGLDKGRDRVGTWTTTQIPIGSGDHLVELTFEVSEDVINDVQHNMSSANNLG